MIGGGTEWFERPAVAEPTRPQESRVPRTPHSLLHSPPCSNRSPNSRVRRSRRSERRRTPQRVGEVASSSWATPGNSRRPRIAKDVPKDQKPAVGARLNQLKAQLEQAFSERQAAVGGGGGVVEVGVGEGRTAADRHDRARRKSHDEPGSSAHHHAGKRKMNSGEVSRRWGSRWRSGWNRRRSQLRQVNIPPSPGARPDRQLLRRRPGAPRACGCSGSQTSTVQVRVMEEGGAA